MNHCAGPKGTYTFYNFKYLHGKSYLENYYSLYTHTPNYSRLERFNKKL